VALPRIPTPNPVPLAGVLQVERPILTLTDERQRGTLRPARPTPTQMVEKHQLGTRRHGHPTHMHRMAVERLLGMQLLARQTPTQAVAVVVVLQQEVGVVQQALGVDRLLDGAVGQVTFVLRPLNFVC
jgi:hypothetical protein